MTTEAEYLAEIERLRVVLTRIVAQYRLPSRKNIIDDMTLDKFIETNLAAEPPEITAAREAHNQARGA